MSKEITIRTTAGRLTIRPEDKSTVIGTRPSKLYRRHDRPHCRKNDPYYLYELPWVATSGSPKCPCEYNNGAHAAIHSLFAALSCERMEDVQHWLKQARRQINRAVRASMKKGAQVPVPGRIYKDPEDDR